MSSTFCRKSHVFALVLFLGSFAIPSQSWARYLAQASGLCADGETEWMYALIQDDCTGQIAQIYIDCNGQHHVGRVCRPDGTSLTGADILLPVSLPPNFSSLVIAGDFSTPGGDQGVYMTDAANQQVRFRNPVNQTEANALQAIIIAEQNCGKTSIGKRFDPNKKMGDRFREKVVADMQATRSSGERWKADLADAYLKGKYGTGAPMIGCGTDMSVDSKSMEGLLHNRSTMVMKQTPSPDNGQHLLLEPFAPFLAGPVSVINQSGHVVWQGNVTSEVVINMADQPSGLYFVRAMAGLSLPFNVVR